MSKEIEIIKFDKNQFERGTDFPNGWHLMNNAKGQQGEYTLCGIAFDGDATAKAKATYKREGKITCENCIAIIKLCKSVNY